MEIKIQVTEEEKAAVLKAIDVLNENPNIKYMSQTMIANNAGIKPTKVRAVLMELIEERKIIQYRATDNPKLQRFYYITCMTYDQCGSGPES